MKLVLHIGAHKTATTTIQRAFGKSRSALADAGIWYPAYPEVFPDMANHYAHLDVAKGLMDDSELFDPRSAAQFFSKLREHAPVPENGTVLISAEPFYRGVLTGDGDYWERRNDYVARVRDSIPFDSVQVVLVLRRQDQYLESLYGEHVKATRYTNDVRTFLKEYRQRFEYSAQIALWSKYFPDFQVLTFEEVVAHRSPAKTFLETALGVRGVRLKNPPAGRNVSLPVDMIEFKRHLNATSLSRAELRTVASALEGVARERGAPAERTSRLSPEERKHILDEFETDNSWINKTFFGNRSQGLFPSEIEPLRMAPELDVKTSMNITAELIKKGISVG